MATLSFQMEGLSDADVAAAVMDRTRKFLGNNFPIQEPTGVLVRAKIVKQQHFHSPSTKTNPLSQ